MDSSPVTAVTRLPKVAIPRKVILFKDECPLTTAQSN